MYGYVKGNPVYYFDILGDLVDPSIIIDLWNWFNLANNAYNLADNCLDRKPITKCMINELTVATTDEDACVGACDCFRKAGIELSVDQKKMCVSKCMGAGGYTWSDFGCNKSSNKSTATANQSFILFVILLLSRIKRRKK